MLFFILSPEAKFGPQSWKKLSEVFKTEEKYDIIPRKK